MLEAQTIFNESIVSITYEGKRHPGAALSSMEHQKELVKDPVYDYKSEELIILSKIADSQPQRDYLDFNCGFNRKSSFLMRAVPDISQLWKRLLDTIRKKFIPFKTVHSIYSDNGRNICCLTTYYASFTIPIFY